VAQQGQQPGFAGIALLGGDQISAGEFGRTFRRLLSQVKYLV
jgi:hypothetical protein